VPKVKEDFFSMNRKTAGSLKSSLAQKKTAAPSTVQRIAVPRAKPSNAKKNYWQNIPTLPKSMLKK